MSNSRSLHASTSLLALLFCMILLFSSAAEASVLAQGWDGPEEPLRSLKGNLVLRVYPNGTVATRAVGSLEQALKPGTPRLPVKGATCDLSVGPGGFNLTEVQVSLSIKLDPSMVEQLSGLRLDVKVHSEEMQSNASVDFELPGLLGANGSIHTVLAGENLQGETALHLTLRLWYGEGTLGRRMGVTRELIEELVANFEMYTEVFQQLLGQYTDGNLTLTELTLEHSELAEAYGTLRVHAQVEGSYAKASAALASAFTASAGNMEAIERLTEELAKAHFTKALTTDASITYEAAEQAFNAEFTQVVEGDFDREVNTVKNVYLQYLEELTPQLSSETYTGLKEFLLPTNVSARNLHATFEYHSSETSHGFSFTAEGFAFQPVRPEAVLPFLRESSFRTPMPDFNLTLEGGSDEHEMVEIHVPETVAPPLTANPHRAIWALAKVTGLDEVWFEAKPNSWGVADFNVQTETAVIAGALQPVVFVTNSTILESPEIAEDHLSVRVEGPSGTRGAMNITMPIQNGIVETTVNGLRVEPQVASNGTHYFVYLQYGQSVDTIHVVWPTPTLTMKTSETKVETGRSITVTGGLGAAGEALAGKAIRILVDDEVAGTVLTNAQGNYSYSQAFNKAGSYEVKAVFPYYQTSFESPAATLTVEVSLLQRPEVLAGIVAAVAVVIALGYALTRRGRRAAQAPA